MTFSLYPCNQLACTLACEMLILDVLLTQNAMTTKQIDRLMGREISVRWDGDDQIWALTPQRRECGSSEFTATFEWHGQTKIGTFDCEFIELIS